MDLFDISSVPFAVMSLLAISVQSMLFQFRVNQGENENLTGLYYLYTETLLSSCCHQQSALIMHTQKHTRASKHKENLLMLCIVVLLDTDFLLHSQ